MRSKVRRRKAFSDGQILGAALGLSLLLFPAASATQAASVCGIGVVEAGEECDDGNLTGLDGCAADCSLDYTASQILDASGDGVTDVWFPDGIAIDDSGNVFLTGRFKGTVDFGGGDLVSTGPFHDGFLAKYSPNGTHLWSQSFGGTRDSDAQSVATDDSGNVFITGDFTEVTDFGGGNLLIMDLVEWFTG